MAAIVGSNISDHFMSVDQMAWSKVSSSTFVEDVALLEDCESSDNGEVISINTSNGTFTLADHLLALEAVLKGDLTNEEAILALPKRRNKAQHDLALLLAKQLGPDESTLSKALTPEEFELASIIRYERLTRPAKQAVRKAQKQRMLETLQPKSNAGGQLLRIQGPWAGQELDPLDLNGPIAIPIPVVAGTSEDFAPVFSFLAGDKAFEECVNIHGQDNKPTCKPNLNCRFGYEEPWGNPMLEFNRGIVYQDGRLDLCKKVVGPMHIGSLMASLRSNHHIRHFLLGNNAISTTGAKEIGEFLKVLPDRMETWYLAGCHMTQHGLSLLVPRMIASSTITNLWFKRNPFGPDSALLLAELVLHTKNLRTLDLENTELGDIGATAFVQAITGLPTSLKHLYLNANGLSTASCSALSAYLAHPACKLKSLFMSTNPLGDAGIASLAPGLAASKTLKRLGLSSTGLTNKGLSTVASALRTVSSNGLNHPLQSLILGASQTTRVHGQRYNYFDDACLPSLIDLIQLPNLRFLDMGRPHLTAESMQTIDTAISQSQLLYLNLTPLYEPSHLPVQPPTNPHSYSTSSPNPNPRLLHNVQAAHPHITSYNAFLQSPELRFLRNTSDVRLIDSMYRTRDQRAGVPADAVWKEGTEEMRFWELVTADAEVARRGDGAL